MPTRVFLVRHGATSLTVEDRFAGSTDIPLSEEGRRQVASLAERLKGENIDAIYASPLQRTMETARILSAPTIAPAGGESGVNVLNRALPVVRRIVEEHRHRSVMVVSHKGTNRLLITSLLGFDMRGYRDRLDQSPAALSILDFMSEVRPRLLLFNDVSHYERVALRRYSGARAEGTAVAVVGAVAGHGLRRSWLPGDALVELQGWSGLRRRARWSRKRPLLRVITTPASTWRGTGAGDGSPTHVSRPALLAGSITYERRRFCV